MNERRFRHLSSLLPAAIVLLVLASAGCRRQGTPSGERTAPHPNAPALYGAPTGRYSTDIPRVRVAATNSISWKTDPFYVLETELSPATLVHSSTTHLGLFTGMTNSGLGAPTYVAWSTMNGPRTFKRADKLDVTRMDENWVLVWWAGAEGWTNWDSPWVVYLQHKPARMALDEDGLHLDFPNAAGDVVLMPLYGYEKLPTKDLDYQRAHGMPDRKTKLETWKWPAGLTRDPLTRIRYWAASTRELPIHCEDSFSVDSAKDSVTLRSRFTWHSIDDDWKTRHLKLAPLSPPLAHVVKEGGFPVELSARGFDLDLCTPYGPYLAVEGADSFDATLSVLQYLNEAEASVSPDTNAHPTVSLALDKLRQVARQKFQHGDRYTYDHGGLNNFCWAIQGDGWYARALPYYDEATRANALASLRKYFHEDVLVANRFKAREYPKGSGREYFILEGPGIGSWGVLGDAGKFSANLLETLWAYAHFTGDWELIKDRWPLVKKLFVTPAETRWVGFGRDAIAEIGDEAAHCAAFARMAYRVGDMDAYGYGCSMFARELLVLFLKQRGADYFRRHQPWHSMEFMDEEFFLTNLWGDTAGWQMDGPKYPAKTGERQFNNRWVRFKDFDVARFYREYLKDDVRQEVNWLQSRWEPRRKFHNDSHIMPSLVQLRSLLLNESPAGLAAVATPDQFTGPPSGEIASCLSVLRTSHPTRYERLIPGGPPSPFVVGLEREVSGPNVHLLTTVQHEMKDRATGMTTAIWPQLTWWGWKTPTGARWNFGQITPVRGGTPTGFKVVPLNWNSQVVTYSY